ncbi:MAG TPA: twin-arginine translocase TatA/TatE family subunit [Euryarchaeota archaeon]|nr:twin-arginine translocase TatA/TatE family subunit [Euryarchaeota archaeon]
MIGTNELLIILLVVLVLFGGNKLPELARSVGKARVEFKKGIDEEEEKKEEKKEEENDRK